MKLIVFDFDGTLVDSQHVIIASVRAAFARWELPAPTDDAIRGIVGLRLVEGLARLAPGLETARHEALAQAYREGFSVAQADAAGREVLFPGVPDMLAELAGAGFTLGIATGKSRRGLLAGLERHALGSLFMTLQTGDVPPGKPHPAMLLRAIEAAGVAPHETVMIGDTTFDIAMACAAGALPIGVAWGYHAVDDLRAAGAAHVVASVAEVVPLLARLVAGPAAGAR
ncbi:MAG: HAD-IA family hydrolase [Proteobacteria bacterium]|nr:HAD-IA family hydrolase [Pseudomonadota bacterium]